MKHTPLSSYRTLLASIPPDPLKPKFEVKPTPKCETVSAQWGDLAQAFDEMAAAWKRLTQAQGELAVLTDGLSSDVNFIADQQKIYAQMRLPQPDWMKHQ